jgi:Ca2+-binding RTX toxin-like protein
MSSYSYSFSVDRESGMFDMYVDYYIEPYYDPESFEEFAATQWTLSYAPLGQPGGWSVGGEGTDSGWATWPIGLASGPLPQQNLFAFEAMNTFSTVSLSFSVVVTDAALATESVRAAGDDRDDLMMVGWGDDRVTGGGGHDRIDAWLGDDRLWGGTGNDQIDGGGGADRMLGGEGSDLYVIDSLADRVIEHAGQGTDTIWSAIDLHLGAHVEDLVLLGIGDLTGRGNAAANDLEGNVGANLLAGRGGDDEVSGRDGADWLIGGAGDDLLDGGTGNDRMFGGSGDDTYVVNSRGDRFREAADGGTDTVSTSLNRFRLDDTIENLSFTAYNARGIGNAGDNRIIGGYGADVLRGGAGDDLLSGYVGADRLRGGTGADVFRFDDSDSPAHARDVILDFTQIEGDRIDLTWVGGLTFRGEAGFTGSGHEVAVRHAHGDTFVDVGGAGGAVPLSIRLEGVVALTETDFIL